MKGGIDAGFAGKGTSNIWPLVLALCLVLSLAIVSCGGGGGGSRENDDLNDPLPEKPTGEIDTGNMLALVLDSGDEPVQGAIVGDAAATTAAGVAAGTLTPPFSGWVEISAPGYAPNYARKEGSLEGRDIYEAILTPVSASALHESGSITIIYDQPAQPSIQLSLPPSLFNDSSVMVELARIEPVNLGPAFAGNNYDDTLGILVAFSVEARNAAGNEAAFAEGQTVEVTIVDNGEAGSSPLLASFNAEAGTWEIAPGACDRLDATSIQCQMEHFSINSIMGNFPTLMAGNDYTRARGDLEQATSDWADEGGGDTPPDEVNQALEDMADAAMTMADLNPSEAAKQRLFSVAARAQLLGRMDVSDMVWHKAAEVTSQIASALLADPDCGKLKELLGAAAQCQVMNLNELAEDLLQKARDLLNTCNLWTGTVNFVLMLEDPYPYLEEHRHYSGPPSWSEKHSLLLAIDPQTHSVDVEDTVSIAMSQVAYRIDEGSHECGTDYLERKNWVTGDRIDLSMDGAYTRVNDRPDFTFTALRKDSGKVSFSYSDLVHYWDIDPCNLNEQNFGGVSLPDYSSLLMHGFSGEIPLSLETMLNQGAYSNTGDMEFIRGSRVVDIPVMAKGLYPFTRAMVSWSFVHELPEAAP